MERWGGGGRCWTFACPDGRQPHMLGQWWGGFLTRLPQYSTDDRFGPSRPGEGHGRAIAGAFSLSTVIPFCRSWVHSTKATSFDRHRTV